MMVWADLKYGAPNDQNKPGHQTSAFLEDRQTIQVDSLESSHMLASFLQRFVQDTWFQIQFPANHFHLSQLSFIQGHVGLIEVAH